MKNKHRFILFFLFGFFIFNIIGCSFTDSNQVIMDESIVDEPVKRLYPLLDNHKVMHKYRDNFDKLIFPRHNRKLTQYCSVHRNWEDIKAVWSKNGGDNFRWQYHVMKNKKSFK